jgi:hypothetical protein
MRTLFRWFSIVTVSLYLLLALCFLLVTGRVRSPGFLRMIAARFRHPFKGKVATVQHESGHCWVTPVPKHLLSDRESWSKLQVLEDGRPLPQAHSAHDDIRRLGSGRFSHWGDQIYFSTSDNSDPATNERTYEIVEQR